MDEVEIKNAVIKSATLFIEDHMALTSYIHLDYGGSGQGFGGYDLYLPKTYKHHELLSHAGHFIYRILEIAGVKEWNDLPGKTVRARASWSKVEALGHIVKDDWFFPGEDFSKKDT